MVRTKFLAALAAAIGILAGPAAPAQALVSVGYSCGCDYDAHCVAGWATSGNAGAQRTTVMDGAAAATCYGTSNGAILLEVTCSVGGRSSTTSMPGPSGGTAVTAPVSHTGPERVCWQVTGYFMTVNDGMHVVTTSGCGLAA